MHHSLSRAPRMEVEGEGGPALFAGASAWFSASVDPAVPELWQAHAGSIAASWKTAKYIFSDDANHGDTKRLFERGEYKAERLSIFRSDWVGEYTNDPRPRQLGESLGRHLLSSLSAANKDQLLNQPVKPIEQVLRDFDPTALLAEEDIGELVTDPWPQPGGGHWSIENHDLNEFQHRLQLVAEPDLDDIELTTIETSDNGGQVLASGWSIEFVPKSDRDLRHALDVQQH